MTFEEKLEQASNDVFPYQTGGDKRAFIKGADWARQETLREVKDKLDELGWDGQFIIDKVEAERE